MTSCSTSRWHFLNQRQLSRITHGKHVPFVAPSSCQIASAPPQIVALMGEILCLDLQWKHGTLHTRTSFPLVHFHLSFSLFPCILLITILVPLQFHFYHYRKIKFWVLYNTFMTYRIQTSLIHFAFISQRKMRSIFPNTTNNTLQTTPSAQQFLGLQ